MTTSSRFAVLLHGLGRSAFSMRPVARRLAAHGYEVFNVGYPSTTASIPVLATDVAARLATWHPEQPLDFITHSLGGILVRYAVSAAARAVTIRGSRRFSTARAMARFVSIVRRSRGCGIS